MKTLAFIISFGLFHGFCYSQTPPGAGYSLYFDKDDKVDIGSHYSNLNFPFSFSCWIKLDSLGMYPIIVSSEKTQANNGFWINVNAVSGTKLDISFSYGNGSGYSPNSFKTFRATVLQNLSVGRWIHIAVAAISPNDVRIFYNGLTTSGISISGTASSMSTGNGNGYLGYDTLNNVGFFG